MGNNYEDIINLPHPEPKHHPRMDRASRAVQFAPFAALTGYDRAVKETADSHDADMEEVKEEYREIP